jgi:hypothetical protein
LDHQDRKASQVQQVQQAQLDHPDRKASQVQQVQQVQQVRLERTVPRRRQ